MEPEKRDKPFNPLPPSSDKDFWGDAEIIQIEKTMVTPPSHHTIVQMGAELVCISCPFQHTVSKMVDNQRGGT
jgi:hypothetical protein